MKTLDHGRKFKEKRYVNSDNVFDKNGDQTFYIKWKCKASMKKEVISSEVGKCDQSCCDQVT